MERASHPSLPPIFQDPPDGLDGDWNHGVLLVGMGTHDVMSQIELARAYRAAATVLIDNTLSHGVEWDEAHPVLFMYRHTIELYLKAIMFKRSTEKGAKNSHNIGKLGEALKNFLKGEYRGNELDQLCAVINEFDKIDPRATVFRFADGGRSTFSEKRDFPPFEIWVDFRNLRESMNMVFDALDHICLTKG